MWNILWTVLRTALRSELFLFKKIDKYFGKLLKHLEATNLLKPGTISKGGSGKLNKIAQNILGNKSALGKVDFSALKGLKIESFDVFFKGQLKFAPSDVAKFFKRRFAREAFGDIAPLMFGFNDFKRISKSIIKLGKSTGGAGFVDLTNNFNKSIKGLNSWQERLNTLKTQAINISSFDDITNFMEDYIASDPKVKARLKEDLEEKTVEFLRNKFKNQQFNKSEKDKDEAEQESSDSYTTSGKSSTAGGSWVQRINFFPNWEKNIKKFNFEIDPKAVIDDEQEVKDEGIDEEELNIDDLEGTLLFEFNGRKTSGKANVYVTENTSKKIGIKTYGGDFAYFITGTAGNRYLDIYAYSRGEKVKTFVKKPHKGNKTDNLQRITVGFIHEYNEEKVVWEPKDITQLYGRRANKAEVMKATRNLKETVKRL